MSQTYPSSLYQMIASVEDHHFWFTARNTMITSLIHATISSPYTSKTFLEIGCGTGIVMATLEKLGFITTGLDVNEKALSYAAKRTHGKLIRQSIFRYTSAKRYDVVGAFDVLEHIRDDKGFLQACYRLLTVNGYLLLTVPAGRDMWSLVDTQSGHVRRYEYEELLEKLHSTGFKIVRQSYWNSLLLPFYRVWHNKKEVAAHLQKMPPIINMVLKWLFHVELLLSRFIRFYNGATMVVCAQK